MGCNSFGLLSGRSRARSQVIPVVLLLALLSAAFPAVARHVLYTEGDRADPHLSIFMDRQGDLYPPKSVIVDTRGMLRGDAKSPEFATLKGLYRAKSQNRADNEWAAILASTTISSEGDFEDDWRRIQDSLRSTLAERIKSSSQGKDDVVLLIHGFNNDYGEATSWYEEVEKSFAQYASAYGHNVTFIRLYWDGLAGSPAAIWTMAQHNGPHVGHGLRRLLNNLDGELPLRVFTHSSGAFVLTNALGDGSSAFPKMGEPYRSRAGGSPGYEIPMHIRNMRIAMLVPAQPLTAFSNYFHSETGTQHGLIPERVVLGTSEKDFATGKAQAFTSCKLYGATCMATQPKNACESVWRDLRIAPPRLMLVNFSQSKMGSHDHAVTAYMKDPEWAELARSLLAGDPAVPKGNELCKKPAPAL